jgi:hypothetical protein
MEFWLRAEREITGESREAAGASGIRFLIPGTKRVSVYCRSSGFYRSITKTRGIG